MDLFCQAAVCQAREFTQAVVQRLHCIFGFLLHCIFGFRRIFEPLGIRLEWKRHMEKDDCQVLKSTRASDWNEHDHRSRSRNVVTTIQGKPAGNKL